MLYHALVKESGVLSMKLIDFLKNVDFTNEYIVINVGEKEIVKTDFFVSENPEIVKVSTDIEGFISITQNDKVISFRPEAVTHFYKKTKLNIDPKS